jgi:chromosome segregation ATPase
MHATEAREQAEAELKASQEEVKELQAKLADFENIIASLNLARDELLNDATERQEELKSSRDVIDELKSTLVELKENLASLQCECSQLKQANEVANCAQKGYEQDAKNSSEEIELLKKQMRSSEIEFKQQLKAEVDRLKSGEYIENYSCDC